MSEYSNGLYLHIFVCVYKAKALSTKDIGWVNKKRGRA